MYKMRHRKNNVTMSNNNKQKSKPIRKTRYRKKTLRNLRGGQISNLESSTINLNKEPVSTSENSSSILNEFLSISGQTIGNVSEWLMNKTASYLGVNPDITSKDVLNNYSNRMYAIKEVLNSPEGKLLLKDANDLVVIASKNVLGPAFTNISENVLNSSGKLITEGTNAVINAISEVPGPNVVVASARLFGNAINAANEASELGTKLFHTSNQTIDKLDQYKERAHTILGKLENLVQDKLDMIQKANTEWAKYNDTNRINIGKQFEQNKIKNQFSNLPNKSYSSNYDIPIRDNTLKANTLRGGKGTQSIMYDQTQIQRGGKQIYDRINLTKSMFI